MKTVITGSIAFDYLMVFPGQFSDHLLPDQLDTISVSFLVDSLQRLPGGTAPNIAYTLALLGGSPVIMATAGKDFDEYGARLRSYGVDTSGIAIIEDKFTASFFANTDQQQNQIGFFYTGAMSDARHLTFAQQVPDAQLAIISPNDPAAMRKHIEECKASGIRFIYDPSQQTIRLSAEELLAGIDGAFMVTVNEYELGMIQEKTGLSQADILGRTDSLLVTRGKAGSTIYARGEQFDIPVFPPDQVVEPTGAGDAFRGGLLRGLQLNLPLAVAGRMGALAATYVLEQLGTQNHHFSPAEFVNRFRQIWADDGALDILLA